MRCYTPLDRLAYGCALRLQAAQPRNDLNISQLPQAGALNGTELVPVYQNGSTVQEQITTLFDGFGIIVGTGSPNGSIVANGGTLFLRTDGSVGNRVYVNQGSGAQSSSWLAISGV